MDTILFPIKWVISWIMYLIHEGLTFIGFADGSGPAWILSIVGLTILIRIMIFPLFNKQIKATRASQELQPEIQKLQKKYKGKTDPISRQRQQEELSALYKDAGTSPLSSCMPLLIQMPIFFALYRMLLVLKPIADGTRDSLGPINKAVATDISGSTLFGAPVSSAFGTADSYANPTAVRVVAVILILGMMVTLFFSQKQVMTKNMPESAMDPNNPMYKTQKYMLYGMPLIYVFSGSFFQVGVLVYWLTSNIWNIGQQTWMLMHNPTPGSIAWKKRQERIRAKRIKKGLPPEEPKVGLEGQPEQRGQRVQPMSKDRAKKQAAKAGPVDPNETPDDVVDEVVEADTDVDTDAEEVRGKDGLTEAERAQKRYERRMAERQRANAKKSARQKKQQQNKKNRNF